MTNQSHGDHWETLFKTDKELMEHLKQMTKEGEIIEAMKTDVQFHEGHSVYTRAASLSCDDGAVSLKGIVAYNEQESVNEVVGTYPVCEPVDSCPSVHLHFKIDQWDDLIEANIIGDAEDGQDYNFFLTNYFENKYLLPFISEGDFKLVGMAYRCLFPTEKKFQFEGQKAIDWLTKIGEEPKYEEDGTVKPVKFDLTQLVSFFPESDEFPDFYQFQSPASEIEEVTAFNVEMYRMKIMLCRLEEDVCATLYVRADMLDRKPEEGEAIRGVMWLQGIISNDIKEQLSKIPEDDYFVSKGNEYKQVIADFNFQNFHDLSAITEPFKYLKIKKGYVLDAYHSINGGHDRLKLYICRANSEWRYEPELVDGKIVPDFQDGMHIDGRKDESLLRSVPPMEDFLEVDFVPEAIWENYLLHITEQMMPHREDDFDDFRYPIFTKWDLAVYHNPDLVKFKDSPRIAPRVNMIDDDSAVISCAFWSVKDGLILEKQPVIRTENGIKYGKPQVTILQSNKRNYTS